MKKLNIDDDIIKNFITNRKESTQFTDVELFYVDFDNFESSKNIIYPLIQNLLYIQTPEIKNHLDYDFKNLILEIQSILPFYVLKFSNDFIQITNDTYFVFKNSSKGLLIEERYSSKKILNYTSYPIFKFKDNYLEVKKASTIFNGLSFSNISSYTLVKSDDDFHFGTPQKNDTIAELIIEQLSIPALLYENKDIMKEFSLEFFNKNHLMPIKFKIYNGYEIISEQLLLMSEQDNFHYHFNSFIKPFFCNFKALEMSIKPDFTKEYIEYFKNEFSEVIDMIEY